MNVTAALLAPILLAPALAAATPEKNEAPPVFRWVVRGDTAAPADLPLVECTRVGYEVDVYGGTAVGTLISTFSHGGGEPVSARFELAPPPAVEILGAVLASGGGLDELAIESVPQDVVPRGRQPRSAPPGIARVRSAPFEVPDDSTFEVRTRFRMPLSVERGIFGLTLPPVEREPARGSTRPEAPRRIVFSSVTVTVHQDAPLVAPASPTHEILVDFLGDRTVIEPVVREFPASEAFAVTFATGSESDPTVAGRVRRDGEGGHEIEILLDPPRQPEKTASRAKEVLFLIDTSGSMAMQEKLEQAKRAVGRALDGLQPSDRFNVIEFDDAFTSMSPAPVAPEEAGDAAAKSWLARLKAHGGTRLLPALESALDQPVDEERHSVLMVVTDGMLADETPVLEMLKDRLGQRRLFVVGTGPMMRQETLLRLAEYGRGAAAFFGESKSLEAAVDDLSASIADPLAWDLKLDWQGGDAVEITPARLPDLYAGRPVHVLAHVRGDLPSSLAVRVSTVDGERRYRVSLPPVE